MSQSTTSAEFFEKMYRTNGDPWDFARSEYEQSRYDVILAALGERRYHRAFEPGCSVGELTWRLAQRCAHVHAMDISATAVERAIQRCSGSPNIDFHVGALTHQTSLDSFDLIVFSEIGYYFDKPRLQALGNMLVSRITASGTLLAAHWLGTSKDHVLSGDHVHEILNGLNGLRLEQTQHQSHFRLDRWVRL